MEILALSGKDILPYLDDLAKLRIEVFREFPYLYDGSIEYELQYLRMLSEASRGVLVAALDKKNLVGASTGMPLVDAEAAFQEPFKSSGHDPNHFFYCAESVLQQPYRGRGIGRRFFEEREAHVRRWPEFRQICFCAVDRPKDHPARPEGYKPLDQFWNRVGFVRRPDLRTEFPWRDVGEETETEKPMTFWVKQL
jgi:GNAT superfamily N-acetyltransferase